MDSGRIMIVDGSAVSRELISRILTNVLEHGELSACASAAEAFALLEQHHYDLIAISPILPDTDGFAFCRKLRQEGKHRNTPVVVIAGELSERLLKAGYEAGVSDYFDKSLGYQAFAEFIKYYSNQTLGHVGHALYVEDSRTAAAITVRALTAQGIEVTHVTSAEQALELLRECRAGTRPLFDVLITDYFLEDDMTGGDLLREVRSRLRYTQRELPILVITGNEEAEVQAELLTTGASDLIQKPLLEQAMVARVRNLLLIRQQDDALKRQAHNIEHVINTDALTGVYNRRYLGERGPLILADSEMQPVWVMIIDVDHLREINEQRGHITGDHVLATIGEETREYLPGATVVRFGGEEFAVLLPRHTQKQALAQAERLRQKIEQHNTDGVTSTVSIGLVCASDHPDQDLNQLLTLADRSLFAAKEGGRNRVYLTDAQGKVHPVKALSRSA